MYVLASHNWFQDLMRTFFFSIDKIVFNFISTIYDLLISIARTSVLSQADIMDMADRIYKLLAVFMVFKVTFSLIMYVVNPDDFSDKSKGVSKLGMNIVFSLAMLVLTPYIFNYAYQFQTIILEDNSLATLIFGEDLSKDSSIINDAGDTIAYMTITPFFTPNLSIEGLSSECSTVAVKDNGKVSFNEKCSGYSFDGSKFEQTSDSNTLYSLINENFSEDTLKNYVAGITYSNIGLTFRQDLALATDANKDNYIIEYKYLFSTVVGVVVVLLLITFCMDVALRSIKLAFLQLIAPIPILSYVDPKSGKDGMFKKWYQMCFKTYLSLFIRLIALYFAIYIIGRVDNMVDIVDGSYQTNTYIKIFIIIGALMFAKSFTKILEGLGLKLDGGFQLNPIKKFQDQALGGKRILRGAAGGAAALGAAGLSGATNLVHRGINTAQRFRNADGAWNKFKAIGSGVFTTAGSTIAGATRGGVNAFGKTNKDGKILKGMWGGYQTSMYSKLLREDNYRKAGLEDAGIFEKIGFAAGSIGADLHRYTGTLNAGQREYLEAAREEAEISNLKNQVAREKTQLTEIRQNVFEPYDNAMKQQKIIDGLLEGNKTVKTAKGNWQNAISRGESDEEIERLRQIYKKTKGIVLEEECAKEGSAINIAVNRHNEMVSVMDEEHKSIYKPIQRTYEQDSSGTLVKYQGNYYTIKHDDVNGNDYFEVNGQKIYDVKDEDRYKTLSGFDIMGDNEDNVNEQKAIFESREDVVNLTNNIQTREREIEARQSALAESEIKNPMSPAKIQNDMRFNSDQQKAGLKPSPNQSSQARFTDSSMYSGLGSSQNSGGNPHGGHGGGHHGGPHGH